MCEYTESSKSLCADKWKIGNMISAPWKALRGSHRWEAFQGPCRCPARAGPVEGSRKVVQWRQEKVDSETQEADEEELALSWVL